MRLLATLGDSLVIDLPGECHAGATCDLAPAAAPLNGHSPLNGSV
jgi:hypothetical protein